MHTLAVSITLAHLTWTQTILISCHQNTRLSLSRYRSLRVSSLTLLLLPWISNCLSHNHFMKFFKHDMNLACSHPLKNRLPTPGYIASTVAGPQIRVLSVGDRLILRFIHKRFHPEASPVLNNHAAPPTHSAFMDCKLGWDVSRWWAQVHWNRHKNTMLRG